MLYTHVQVVYVIDVLYYYTSNNVKIYMLCAMEWCGATSIALELSSICKAMAICVAV